MRSVLQKAEPWIVGVGIPGGLALLAIFVPTVVSMYREVGVLGERMSSFQRTVTSQNGAIDQKLAALDNKISNIKNSTDNIEKRMYVDETDPVKLLAGVGITTTGEATLAFIKGKVWAFPKNADAGAEFEKFGIKKVGITPYISGYVLPIPNEFQQKILDALANDRFYAKNKNELEKYLNEQNKQNKEAPAVTK